MSDSAGSFAIPEPIVEAVNSALTSGLPMILAYVDASNKARLSFRGSIYAYSPDQLALWVRNPEGGLLGALGANPQLTLMYRDPATRTTVFFYGDGHLEDDAATREAVYAAIPEGERKADPEKKGKPLIVDLVQIQGRIPEGPVSLAKS